MLTFSKLENQSLSLNLENALLRPIFALYIIYNI